MINPATSEPAQIVFNIVVGSLMFALVNKEYPVMDRPNATTRAAIIIVVIQVLMVLFETVILHWS